MSKRFELHHRLNGTWYLSIKSFTHYNTGFGSSPSAEVLIYINELSHFLDDEVFKSDTICYKLDNGFSYGEIVEIIKESALEEVVKQDLMTIYKDAQKWFDYNYNTSSSSSGLSYKDYSNLKRLVYNTNNDADGKKRFSYFKILKLIDAMKDFKDL